MSAPAERHLHFGLLAYQNGIINPGQLVDSFHPWALDKSKSLADHLEARGDLSAATPAHLEGLAAIHLKAHDGEVEKSLAAVSAGKSTLETLRGDVRDLSTNLLCTGPLDFPTLIDGFDLILF